MYAYEMKKIISLLSIVAFVAAFSSCRSEDDLTDSIFDTTVPVVDPNKATAPFDQWLYDNFVVPYNVEVQYQFNFPSSDLSFQLAPADYNRSQLLAHMIRYLFYDVYTKYAGEKFMKQYGPRIFHFIGSTGYNATSGTEVLGTASGGVKITLYNVNEMKPFSQDVQYNNDDITVLNERYFHTMHHEFAHILHQTKSIPREFQLLSLGHYDAANWQDRDPRVVNSLGFVTPYGSSEIREDFAETIANFITKTDQEWEQIWFNAGRGYWTEGDETSQDLSTLVYYTYIYYENNEVKDENRKGATWGQINFNDDGTMTLKGQFQKGNSPVTKGDDGKYYDADGKLCDRQGYLLDAEGNRIPINVYDVEDRDGVDGVALLTQKINIARTWFREQWNIDLDALRNAVQTRVSTYDSSVLEQLRQQVYGIQ